MDELIARALDTAQAQGAQYADVRLVRQERQLVLVRNGTVEEVSLGEDAGFGVRALVDGAWGFASSYRTDPAEADAVAGEAVRIARASARVHLRPVQLGEPVRSRGTYRTPVAVDPFAVPLDEKIALLLRADGAMRRVPQITATTAQLICIRDRKTFASTEGAHTEQEIVQTGGGITATAAGEGEVQRRSYPNSGGRNQVCEGYEFVQRIDLEANAPRVAEEAVALLTARQCPPGVTTVILDGSQLALQVHESCGHPIELDRVFGSEAAYAGTSFLTTDKLGTFRYGSEAVTMTADATLPGALGTFGWDDEGVPAQRIEVVKEGLLRRLPDRPGERQPALPAPQHGRGAGLRLEPHPPGADDQRLPGAGDVDAGEPDRGHGRRHLHGDQPLLEHRRPPAQLPVRHGGGLRDQGRQAGGPAEERHLHRDHAPSSGAAATPSATATTGWPGAPPTAGRGSPRRSMHTGHGAAPARFRNVQVGVAR